MSASDAAVDDGTSGLSLLLRAPSRDAIGLLLNAAFRFRHEPGSLASSPSVSAFSLPPDEASRLSSGALELVRRVLYESSELQTAAAVEAKIPAALDAQLRKFITTVSVRGAVRGEV